MKFYQALRMIFYTAIVCLAGISLSPVMAADSTETIKPVFDHPIANVSGKSVIAVEVTYPPGGKSPSHRHADSAFIMAYVVKGAIRSQIEGEPERIYKAGDTWYEDPGAHHVISENASDSKPAKLLAVFVVDSDHEELIIPDEPTQS